MPTLTAPNNQPGNSISLTFNGVDFRLVPSNETQHSPKNNDDSIVASSCSISMAPNSNGQFTMIQLNSFSGTLYVSEQENVGVILNPSTLTSPTTDAAATDTKNSQAKPSTIEIEEASHSSNRSKCNEAKKTVTPSKGQTQLSFERKKRPRLENKGKKTATEKNTKKVSRLFFGEQIYTLPIYFVLNVGFSFLFTGI